MNKKTNTKKFLKIINKYFLGCLLILFLFVSGNFSYSIKTYAKEEELWPIGRACHKMVYVQDSNQIFLFGGVNEFGSDTTLNKTWVFNLNNSNWEIMECSITPSPRFNHDMVYDPVNHGILLFGGYSEISQRKLNDTWFLDLDVLEWTQIDAIGQISHRTDMILTYEPLLNKIILFGGVDQDEHKLDDLWYYDHNNQSWLEIHQNNSPSARYGHEMAYVNSQNSTYLFGGRILAGTTNDFQSYSSISNNWTQIVSDLTPGVRYWHTMDYSQDVDQLVIFGGRDSEYVSAQILGDTWVFYCNQSRWEEVLVDISPSPRVSSHIVYCSNNEYYILFGGSQFISNFQGMADMWYFDPLSQSWEQITQESSTTKISSYPMNSLLGIFTIVTIIITKNKTTIDLEDKETRK